MRRRKFKALAAAAGLATVMLNPAPADAAANTGVAIPGSAVAGYGTQVIVVVKGQPFTFVNGDPTAPHNLRSVQVGGDKKPIFTSGSPRGVGTYEVTGMENTQSGQIYEFFCDPHPGTMRGMLVVI